MLKASESANIAILGASGYTGAELVRLLNGHPLARITALTADRRAGAEISDVFPHLSLKDLPRLTRIEDVNWSEIDFCFCALPHGTTQEVVAGLPETLRLIDLSADFRLRDPDLYAKWYGHAHYAPGLQKTAVYGLSEIARSQIKEARLVANPGCYPTSVFLPLIPLLRAGLVEPEGIIIDAKSGVSGAGRAAKEATLFAEVTEGVHPYGVASHRHLPEIEQELSLAGGQDITVNFTPHLMPMVRGILSSIYVELSSQVSVSEVRSCLEETYASEQFVSVLSEGHVPATRHVKGSNQCRIAVFEDRIKGRAILFSVLDNLVKGASGQAIQNMNLMLGFEEGLGLEQAPLFP